MRLKAIIMTREPPSRL